MSGTRIGGLKAAAKNRAKDPQFYQKIGAKGGKVSGPRGGFSDRAFARQAGIKGGLVRGYKRRAKPHA